MYTTVAVLSLIALWAVLRWWQAWPRAGYGALLTYAVAAAAALYVHYYSLFFLVAYNLIALLLLLRSRVQRPAHALRHWVFAQLLVLLLFLPWLPTLWRQATNPPVPPWRDPWHSTGDVLAAVSEGLSAQLVGQSP